MSGFIGFIAGNRVWQLVPVPDKNNPCEGCAFDNDPCGCLSAPVCGMENLYVEVPLNE